LSNIHKLLNAYESFPLKAKQHKYLLVIQTLYQQQKGDV